MIIVKDGFTNIEVVQYEQKDVFDNVTVNANTLVWSPKTIMIHHLEYPTINFSWSVGSSSDMNFYIMVYNRNGTLIDQKNLGNFNPVGMGSTKGYSCSLRPVNCENVFYPYIKIWIHNNDLLEAQTLSAEIHGVVK